MVETLMFETMISALCIAQAQGADTQLLTGYVRTKWNYY
jgi:hypothetical protein